MKEYIEKQAAIDEILGQPPDAHYPDWYASQVKAIPAEDVVPVVRCKECKHFMSPHACLHDDGMITAQSDGYCSYSERKE